MSSLPQQSRSQKSEDPDFTFNQSLFIYSILAKEFKRFSPTPVANYAAKKIAGNFTLGYTVKVANFHFEVTDTVRRIVTVLIVRKNHSESIDVQV